jgi:hypothetical protein
VLATLTWWRSLVQIQPRLLAACRDLRALQRKPNLLAEWTGAWFPARSHKPYDAGSNPASATCTAEYANPAKRPGREPGDRLWVRLPPRLLYWAYGPTGRCQPGVLEIRVRFPVGPLRNGGQPDTARRAGLLNRRPQGHEGSNPSPSAGIDSSFRARRSCQ